MSLRSPPRTNGSNAKHFTEEDTSLGRRISTRFPLKFPAVLYFRKEHIRGKTANMSSGGLLMICSESELEQTGVQVGARVKVRITGWPTSRPDNTNVGLMVEGVVVRKLARHVAVRRIRHDFVEIKSKRRSR
jgi:PilZ domain